ncbi:MAG: cytochrome c biogenesis protein CcsA, partial [Bacteroidales bacterium]|nr:cytochrome c biogenesis protein CcsA [Bacteroidales bacterium]
FLCVRDPWAPVKETALWIMLVSAILMAAFSGRSGRPWLYAAVLAALTAVFAVFKLVVYGTPEAPVLRSFWFVPHIVAYVAAFVILAAALVLYIIRNDASRKIVRVGWGFLTLGMVIGSIWAKRAWGDYWGWDPKETWAAATWISYLLFLHIPERSRKLSIAILVFSLLLLCMSWWGVNLLPSAKMASMHVY